MATLRNQHSPSACCLLLSILLILWSKSSTQAQEDAPEVAKARAEFESKRNAAISPIREKYVAALRRMEREYALKKDYKSAIAARDERLKVEGESPSDSIATENGSDSTSTGNASTPSIDSDDGSTIVLAPASARLIEGAKLEDDTIVLSAAGDAAEWSLKDPEPGGYEIELTHKTNGRVSFRISEAFFYLKGQTSSTRSRTTTRNFGTLKLTEEAESIRIVADNASSVTPLSVSTIKLISTRP